MKINYENEISYCITIFMEKMPAFFRDVNGTINGGARPV